MTDCGAEPLLPACAAADERLRGWLLAVLRRLYEDRRIEGKEWEHSFYYFFLSVFNFGGVRLLVFRCAPKPLLLARATGGDQIGGSGVGAERGYPPPRQSGSPSCPPPPRARC